MIYSLGNFTFFDFSFPTEIVQQGIETIRYRGVDGEDFRLLGFQGREFTAVGKVDVLNIQSGMILLDAYRKSVSDIPLRLVHNGFDWDSGVDGAWRFKALRVAPGGGDSTSGIKRHMAIAGGLTPFSQYVVTSTWTLLPVVYQLGP